MPLYIRDLSILRFWYLAVGGGAGPRTYPPQVPKDNYKKLSLYSTLPFITGFVYSVLKCCFEIFKKKKVPFRRITSDFWPGTKLLDIKS